MALKRMALELGMGTDVRGSDSTKAAARALNNALHRNALTIARALGQDPTKMLVDVRIGVPDPDTVNRDTVLAEIPYGRSELTLVEGGLKMPNEDNSDAMLLAHAAVVVWLDID